MVAHHHLIHIISCRHIGLVVGNALKEWLMHVVVTHHRIIHHQLSSHWTHRPVVVAMIVKKLSAIAINMPSTSE